MKKSSKIILGLSIAASLLATSQIATARQQAAANEATAAAPTKAVAFAWAKSSGKQTISFSPSKTANCPTPAPLTFDYTKNSLGKTMRVTQSSDGFKTIVQTERKATSGYGFNYTDILGGSPKFKKLKITGEVVNVSSNTMTNSGTWTAVTGKQTCSGGYTVLPATQANP